MNPGECYAQAIVDTLPRLPSGTDPDEIVEAVDARADQIWEADPEQGVPGDVPDGFERLTCGDCRRLWVRKVKRGRKPLTCPDC